MQYLRKLALGGVSLLGLAILPFPLAGQIVRGTLFDDATNEPVVSATVHLLIGAEGVSIAAAALTDSLGMFQLRATMAGTFRLRTLRLGYQPVTTSPFQVAHGEVPTEVEVRVSTEAILLAAIVVRSDLSSIIANPRLAGMGYFDRKERWGREGLGMGEFLERREISAMSPSRVSDALRTVRGVTVHGAGGRRQMISMRRGCPPAVYLDGTPMRGSIDEVIHPSSIAAVEVYPGLSRPVEFSGGACGAIVIWTGSYYELVGAPSPRDPMGPQRVAASDAGFSLVITSATDSTPLPNYFEIRLTLQNLSDKPAAFCLVGSRYTLRGSATNREIAEPIDDDACTHAWNLGPNESMSWHEAIDASAEGASQEPILIQKHLRLRWVDCRDRTICEISVRSKPQLLYLKGNSGLSERRTERWYVGGVTGPTPPGTNKLA